MTDGDDFGERVASDCDQVLSDFHKRLQALGKDLEYYNLMDEAGCIYRACIMLRNRRIRRNSA